MRVAIFPGRASRRRPLWASTVALAMVAVQLAAAAFPSPSLAIPHLPVPSLFLSNQLDGSILLQWGHDGAVASFTVVRISQSGRTDFRLSESADHFVDDPPPTDPLYCYFLLDTDIYGQTGRSDMLCAFPRTRSGGTPPDGFSIALARSNVATLDWEAPEGLPRTNHLLVALGTSRIYVIPEPLTHATDSTGSLPTCYALFARSGTTILGSADLICGVPGFGSDSV